MRYASVYKTNKVLIFCSNAQTTEGVNLSIPPYIHLEKDANAVDVTNAINKVIEGNQFNVPHPKHNEWEEISQKHLAGLGIKSLSMLHKKAIYCSIYEDSETLIFYPARNAGQTRGYEFISDMHIKVPMNASADRIFAALQETLLISENAGLSM
ncbi:hypothetical protein [Longitalea luteola]|uniref:hypothetical protein n=1 Tax=Longitalea luteola TaxID=2812563 RepID=UPI001A9793BE|nr:hypothetical protein [Longitalea luteola]